MTLAEKILAPHCGRDRVSPGELINARVDLVMSNDVTAPIRDPPVPAAQGRALLRSPARRLHSDPLHTEQGHVEGRAVAK